ncbi:hypothetical protein BJ165DRAFT_1531997 [Panaeolus papilionaceus]|nr:hypothetical protein BJ165DRAFT_1531997 [Panaeolus papilionaceus]
MAETPILSEPTQQDLFFVDHISTEDIQLDDKIIVLLGPTGVGKSNFIERLASNNLDISSFGLQRGTNELNAYRIKDHPTWGNRIVLVDTPGFQDATISEYGSLKAIREWIKASKAPRLHALCYTDSIKQQLRGGDKYCWNLFMSICGEASANRTCLVTTRWDEVGDRDGISAKSAQESRSCAEKKIAQLREHWQTYLDKGLHIFEFHNTGSSAKGVLTITVLVDEYVFRLLDEKFQVIRTKISQSKEDVLTLSEQLGVMTTEWDKLQCLLKDYQTLKGEMLEFNAGLWPVITQSPIDLPSSVVWALKSGKIKRLIKARPSHSAPDAPATDSPPISKPTKSPVDLSSIDDSNALFDVPLGNTREDDIIILVMGVTGSGKSSLFDHDTADVKCSRIPIRESQSHLVLVDTPGFDQPRRTNGEILKVIAKWLNASYKQGKKLNGVVYLHRITDIRFDSGASTTLTLFKHICGGEYEHERKEESIKKNHWGVFMAKGSITSRFDATTDMTARETTTQTIRSLTQHNNAKFLLQLQREMVDQRKSLHKTAAGKYAFTKEEKIQAQLAQLTDIFVPT